MTKNRSNSYNNRGQSKGFTTSFRGCSKLSYIHVALYTSIAVTFLLNLMSLILETKSEFELERLESLINKDQDTTLMSTVQSIHQQLHIILVCSVFILVLLCVLFVSMSLSLTAKPKSKSEEETDLLSPSSPLPTTTSLEKSSVILEGPMYEPFNVITIENISAEDRDPYEKIKSTYYRYGISAGRQIYERFGKQLTSDQDKEICWMLGQNNLISTLSHQ